MAAALVLPISGPYVGTWNAQALGTNSDDGYELSMTVQGQEVNETDAYGMTLVEAIYRGENWRVRFRSLELFDAGPFAALQMFGSIGTFSPDLANIGDRWSKFSKTLILTSILGNPPSYPQSQTALTAGLAPQSQSAMLYTSKVRELPLEFVLLPYTVVIASVTSIVPFTTT